MANRTVHSVMHMSWVSDDAGRYRGQMAVLVKPNGLFGTAYMANIAPFRYPADKDNCHRGAATDVTGDC